MVPTRHSFEYDGFQLTYDEYGAGERAVVLMPGLLFSRKMHGPLATTLAERGYRVLCLDLLGHGDSDRPPEMWNYSMAPVRRSRRWRCWTTWRSTRRCSAGRRWARTPRWRRAPPTSRACRGC